MKWILAILLLISYSAIGQSNDSTKYIWYKTQYGLRQPRIAADSFLHAPYGDTTGRRGFRPGAIMMHVNKKIYRWEGNNWIDIGSPVFALNGLHKDGDTIKLGGTLTELTDINNSGNSFVLHGTGDNVLKTVNGTLEALAATSPTGVASLSAANSATNGFSEINSTDEMAIINAGINGLFYNYQKLDSSGFTIVTRANIGGGATFKINNLGKMSNSAYTPGGAYEVNDSTAYKPTVMDVSGNIYRMNSWVGGGSSGEVNTASNQGTGVGVFKAKFGVDLQFKSLTTPASVSAASNTNDVAVQLVNDQASPSRWRFYGSKINDSSKGFQEIEENFLGILYNKNSWADLSDFTTNGVTASVVSNKIQVTPVSNGIYSCFLALNNTLDSIAYSNLQKWKFTIRVIVDEKTGTSYGFGQGMRSYNSYGKFNAIGRFAAYTGGGELYLTGGLDSVTLNTSARKLVFSAGDRVVLTVERDGGYLTTNVRNITTNSSLIDTSYYYSYNSAPYMPNTGKFAIWGFGGQFTVDSICISSNEVKNARLLIGGNSKMQGYLTSGYAQTAPAMLNSNFKTTVLHAGGSDRTIDFARSLKEVLAQRPQQVVLVDLMSNDIRQGAESSATIYARYDSITSVLVAAGIDVYHSPLYETSIDLSGVYAHIVGTYPASKILPTYSVGQLGGNLSGDGVHLNDAGNTALYNAIVQSYKLYGGNNRYGSTSGGQPVSGTTGSFAKFTSSSTVGSSSVSENSTTVVSSKGLDAPSLTLTNSSGGTDQKIWNQFPSSTTLSFATVNDAKSTNTNWMTINRSGTTPTAINLLTNTSVSAASGTALTITPVANTSQIGISGTVSGYAIPTNFSINASGGIFGNYINTNSGSSAHSEIAIGSTGASAFTAYRNNNTNVEYTVGQETISGEFRINYGTFPTLTGGSNRVKINSSGAITFDNAYTFPTADGSSGQTLQTNGSGTVSWANPLIKYQHTISTPSTGGTVSLLNGQYNIINPSGTIATLTINLPSSPANNDVVYIKYTQAVTTVTYGNGTVVDGIISPTAGGLVILTYDAGTSSWY